MSSPAQRTRIDQPHWTCRRLVLQALALVAGAAAAGCSSSQWAQVRRIPRNPLTKTLKLDSRSGPQPTDRTLQTLRQYDLLSLVDYPEEAVAALQRIADEEPTPDHTYAIAEIAYIGAKKREALGQWALALDLFGTAVANSYVFLFEQSFTHERNPYDPRFRRACDLYNASLESALRYLQRGGCLRPGATHTMQTGSQMFDVRVASRDTWHEGHFRDLKFVSDFDVQELRNEYRTYGLGVPMIAVYQTDGKGGAAEPFYPPGMSFPVTAFLRVGHTSTPGSARRYDCVVELHDSTRTSHVQVNQHWIPLEIDLTTPLAYSLDNPAFRSANQPVKGLRDPDATAAVSGLYMLEPFDPDKIPVVMIHGFWSSIVTWMEMYNDLRGTPEIRDHYQFWFYLYPSGQPFWYSAAHLRQQLRSARQSLDPMGHAPALDQMVLVGHSAGGLIAELQTLHSGDDFWRLVSHQPLDAMPAAPDVLNRLRQTFYFEPDKSVRRVVTIATPHLGSNFSNQTTQWLGRKLIQTPKPLQELTSTLQGNHQSGVSADSMLNVTTNVGALAAGSPFLLQMRGAPHAPWVYYHNVLGHVTDQQVLANLAADSDGVVSIESAHFPQAISELKVNALHAQVHRHPRTILEVRRILLEHLRTHVPETRAGGSSPSSLPAPWPAHDAAPLTSVLPAPDLDVPTPIPTPAFD